MQHHAAVALPRVERTGVLVIRAWIESNGQDRLRARITRTSNLDCPGHTLTVAATPEEITATVLEWIDGLTRAGPGEDAARPGRGDDAVTEQ